MPRRALLFPLVLAPLLGCATAEQPFPLTDGGTDARRDTGNPFPLPDTGSAVDEDTGSAVDSSVVIEDTGSPDPVDTGTFEPFDTGSPDTSVADTGSTGSGDAGTTLGTRVYTGNVRLDGVTTDGYVIVTDTSNATWAVPLAGGTAQAVRTGTSRVLISGKVVFAWGTLDLYGFAPLTAWTLANGSKSVATKSLAPGSTAGTFFVAAASTDGANIAFTDNAVGGSSDKADLRVSKSDGTGAKTVFTQYVTYDGSLSGYGENCAPFMGFVGTRFVTTHCTPSGSSVTFDASSIDPATGTASLLGSGLTAYWAADRAGTKVAVVTSDTLKIIAPTGGAALTIDTNVSYGTFSSDGSAIVYRTKANALKRSSTTTAAPTTLVASGVTGLLSTLSPDDKWILYSSIASGDLSDVRLASATTAGTGTALHTAANAAVYGAGFTADSSHAVFYTSVVDPGVGTLVAAPVAGGANVTLGANAWYDTELTGGKLAFNDNHVGTASSGTATLRVRNLGVGGSSPTILADNADRTFAVTAARDKIVYIIKTTASAGAWVASVP